MGKILLFIYDEMADFEVNFLVHNLSANLNKDIISISYESKLIKSKSGLIYKSLSLVSDVLIEDVDALIIPGGWNLELRPELITLIQKLDKNNKLIGAICSAPLFLAKASILDNKKYTTSITTWTDSHIKQFNEIDDPFPRKNFIYDRVVKDNNIITAQGYAFIDFAIEILDYFKMFEDENDKIEFIKIITNN